MQSHYRAADRGSVDRRSLALVIFPTVAVILALLAGFFSTITAVRLPLFSLAGVSVVLLLLRVAGITRKSQYAGELAIARVHILLHLAPLVFFLALQSGISALWVQPGLVLLLVLFFFSGRKTWQVLAGLYPATHLYRIFYRANSVFLLSFPALYLGSLLLPDLLAFGLITRMAIFYFSVHFSILGVSSLKIESDLLPD